MAAEVSTGEPTSEEILNAIDVLKRAGLNITAGSSVPDSNTVTEDVRQERVNPSTLINPEYDAINMMMGSGNSNNNDPMTMMLPYMLNNNENGKNIDPQMVQFIMMNSMMNSINGLNTTDEK